MRWLRGVSSAMALVAIIAAAPFALLTWGRYPLLTLDGLLRPDDGSLLLGLVTALGWLAWAVFGLATAMEIVRLVAGRPVIRLPGLAAVQHLSAGLLLAVIALAATSAAPRTQPETSIAQVPRPPVVEPSTADDAVPAEESGYRVQQGDDLWSISEATLGDGRRWRELAAANPELLADPVQELRAGTVLTLPAGVGADSRQSPPSQPDATHAESRPSHDIVVKRGDTLSELAFEHLGAASHWPRIAAANRELIKDPDHIEVGWRLVIPGAQASPPTSSEPAETDADEGRTGSSHPTPPSRLDPPDARTNSTPAPTGPAVVPQMSVPAEPQGPPVTAQTGPVETDPASNQGSSPTTEPSASPDSRESGATQSASPFGLIGPVGTLAAAVIIGAVETRRALRLRERPRGRRFIDADPAVTRLRVALGSVQRPDRILALDRALRHLGERLASAGRPLPQLSRIELDDHALALDWAHPAGDPPPGFAGGTDCWQIALAAAIDLGPSEYPCPYPCVVSVGTAGDGRTILVNAEQSRVLGVAADDAALAGSALLAMGIELACAPWSSEVQVLTAGAGSDTLALAGGERVRRAADLRSAISEVAALAAERRTALSESDLFELRADPDRADAVAPLVLVLGEEPSPIDLARLERALDGTPCGVVALLPTASAGSTWQVRRTRDALSGSLDGLPTRLVPHTVPSAIAQDLAGLLAGADSPATEPAWWAGSEALNVRPLPNRAEEPVDIVRLITDSEPRLLLIGPTDLTGARGEQPTRARQQLIELCAWILEHPHSTATQMAASMGIAEGTRRSNLSRLRSWLGTTSDGEAYLPEAYAGRIELHPAVTSDWHQLQTLLAAGLDQLPDSSLVAALELVRGAPLADAAPGQWHWAEELRADISSALRDAALVLTERALARRDLDLARWAAARALTVAPADELLMAARIRTEHLAGNTTEVNRLVTHVTRQARQLGVDLLPETIELCQQVVEGSIRARWA